MVSGVWTGVGFSNLKKNRTRIQIKTFQKMRGYKSKNLTPPQVRNEVVAPGAKSTFGVPMFETEMYWRKYYLLRLVGTPRSCARGIVPPSSRSCSAHPLLCIARESWVVVIERYGFGECAGIGFNRACCYTLTPWKRKSPFYVPLNKQQLILSGLNVFITQNSDHVKISSLNVF